MKEKLVIATTNKNKVERIKKILKNLNFEIVSLSDVIKNEVKEPEEHYEIGIEDKDDPNGHIKEPVIKKYGKFTDELAAKYYCDLATKYSGTIPVVFKYGHALAIITNKDRLRKKLYLLNQN